MKAIWENTVIAESDDTVLVEGNHYFPIESVNKEFLTASDSHSSCPWKGIASYYNVQIGNKKNDDAAWYYSDPKKSAMAIKDHIAFWKGVEIKE